MTMRHKIVHTICSLLGDGETKCHNSSMTRRSNLRQRNITNMTDNLLIDKMILRVKSIHCWAMATYRHWSVSLWRDPDDVSHWRIMSPDKTEWWLISATLSGWRRCFVADQLRFMTCIREEEDCWASLDMNMYHMAGADDITCQHW